MSESRGKTDIEITIKDKRTLTGKYQLGEARLTDYGKAEGTKFSISQFNQDASLQDKVVDWNLANIAGPIDRLCDRAD